MMEYIKKEGIKKGYVIAVILFVIVILAGIYYLRENDRAQKDIWYEYNRKIKQGITGGIVEWPNFDRILEVNGRKIKIAVADTYEKRTRGFMKVREIPPDSGMLFVFEKEGKHCFWMKDTYVKLSIAFINKNMEIMEIKDMEPLDEKSICPQTKILYALEVPYNYFKLNNIKEGDRVVLK